MQAYTYLLKWTDHDMSYYGFRCANKVTPEDDLWKEYFSSSERVKEFREHHGDPDIVLVDRVFGDRVEAKLYETEYLRNVGVPGNSNWLNRSDGSKNFFHGNKHSEEAKKKMSAKKQGSRKPMSEETKRKIGEKLKGNNNGQQPGSNEKRSSTLAGRKLDPEHAARISAAKKGRKFTEEHKAAIRAAKARKKNHALNTHESQ
jgi:NUMOD3 motif